MGEKCIVKLNIGPCECLYLKSLFPIRWTEFISDGEWYSSIDEAKEKLNSRHYQLSTELVEMNASENCIEIARYIDGKYDSSIRYIGG